MLRVWTVREVARKFRVLPVTVHWWLKDGKLVGTKNPVNGYWEVTQAALSTFKRPRRGRQPGTTTVLERGMAAKDYLSLKAIATDFGVSYVTVWGWVRQGHLPAFQIRPRGRWFVPRGAISQIEENLGYLPEPYPHQYLDFDPNQTDGAG